jgi:hypothetical protein
MSGSAGLPAYRILAYGIETKALQFRKDNISSRKYSLLFGGYKDAIRFQDFDAVILFQGTFESFKPANNGYRSYLIHKCDHDELDKRTKEALTLIGKGGIVCMLLTDPFIDFDDRRDFSETDLSKRLLSRFKIRRDGFPTREPFVRSKVNELGQFFELYGAAWTGLSPGHGDKTSKTLASANGARPPT